MSSSYKKIAKHLTEIDGKLACKCCRLYDDFTGQCCFPNTADCVEMIAETLAQRTQKPKPEKRDFAVGDTVMANGVGKVVFVAQHHKNNDETDALVTQYVVQYPSRLLEIRTNASLNLIDSGDK